MPLITGNRAVEKAYIGTTGLNAIMHAGVNLLDGTVLPSTGRTLLSKLTSSLILNEGTGNPAFSMATAYWTDKNDLGLLRQYPASSAFFGGARLVRNLARNTEDLNAWSKLNSPTCVGNTVKFTDGTEAIYRTCSTITSMMVNVALVFTISADAACTVTVELVDINDGTPSFAKTVTVTTTPTTYRINCDLSAGTMSLNGPGVYVNRINNLSVAGKTITLSNIKVFDYTGYDASYEPPYLSVGVLPAPYLGANIDGAKYYNTDWQGAPIAAANLNGFLDMPAATNSVLWNRDFVGQTWTEAGGNFTPGAWIPSVTGSNIVTNGDFASDLSEWTGSGASTNTWSGGKANIDGTGGLGGIYRELTTTVGKTYLITVEMTAISGSGNATAAIKGATVGSTTIRYDGAATSKNISLIFKATLTSHVLYLYSSAGRVAQFDNVVVKECTCAPERTATGIDGIANSATRLTFVEANAVIKQALAGLGSSTARCTSAYIKLGTPFVGPISMTQDDGATWVDVTSQLNSSTYVRPQITSTLANPIVGFKSGTPGDVVDVDVVGNEAGTIATPPIVTTIATVNRGASSLAYQTAGNFADAAGTAFIEAEPVTWVGISGGAIGSATNGLLLSSANSGATAYDGTNAANGPTGTPSGREKIAMRWGSGAMTVASGGVVGTPGIYDGAMGLSSIGIGVGSAVYVRNVAIYDYAMTDAELQAITT